MGSISRTLFLLAARNVRGICAPRWEAKALHRRLPKSFERPSQGGAAGALLPGLDGICEELKERLYDI